MVSILRRCKVGHAQHAEAKTGDASYPALQPQARSSLLSLFVALRLMEAIGNNLGHGKYDFERRVVLRASVI